MIVFTWIIIMTCVVETNAFAVNTFLPDSLITDDYVYEYTFRDFDKAQQIMVELRKHKSHPHFKLDITEGDLFFNTGKHYQALKFYKRALDSDSVRTNDKLYMEQIHRMVSCYDCLYNEAKKVQYVEILLKKAKQCDDKAMQSVALFNMGKMLYYQGNKGNGYEYMQRAVALMEETNYKYKYDNLRYNYNTLLVFQELDKRSKEALRTLKALEKVVTEKTGIETPMEGLNEKEKKAMYAHYAVVLSRLGKKKEAEDYYKKFLSTGKEYDRDNYLIMPYLFDRKMYDEVIHMNSVREKTLAMQGDTVNYHMTTNEEKCISPVNKMQTGITDIVFTDADLLEQKSKKGISINDQSLFDKAEYEIINRQLFLQPDFSREKLMKIIHIPKNKFALLFKQYVGKSFSRYISNLRMQHAAKLLKEHPEYTIEAVSQSYCFDSLNLAFLYYLCKAIINKGYDERETAYSDHK